MTDLVFVDTNVLVYARDARDGMRQRSAEAWLRWLWHEQTGRISVQVLSEYYVTVTRKLSKGLSPDEAWDDVEALMLWQPQPTDETLLRRSREVQRRYRLNWWDSLIVAAAQLQGCVALLTEDLQDGAAYGSVTVRSPFTLTAEQVAAAYEVSAVRTVRHPARGRPKRTATRSL